MNLPSNLDAERHLLGCLIRDGLPLPEGLIPSDFYEPKHQDIAATLAQLEAQGITPDEVTVSTYLRDLETSADHVLVNDLTTAVGFSTLNRAWAEAIANTGRLRRIASINLRISQAVADPATDPDSLLAYAEGELKTIAGALKPKAGPARMPIANLLAFDRKADPYNLIGNRWLCRGSSLVLAGQAGTGKTLLAVASALHLTFDGVYNGVTVSRPVIPMGDTLGFLPGSLEEKLDPWLKPVYDALEFLLTPEQGTAKRKQAQRPQRKGGPDFPSAGGGKRSYDPFLESGLIEIEALCYIRGRSIPNRFFILDEAQQLTPLEAKTIVTRMARGSKLVLVGDPAQIDNPYVDRLSNGLVYTRDRLRDEACSTHVTLERGERSQLAEAAARKM